MSQFNLLMRAIAVCLALLGPVCTAAAQRPARSDTIIVRTRVIGVYDSDTGQPIEGAEVRDILTGLSALTSVTGTLVLPMDTAGAFLRVRKLGFNMLTQVVPNGTADTLPITLTMDRAGQFLPTVTSRARGVARGPADTVRRLEWTGFYDRREYGGAPRNAYISQEQIDRWAPTLLSDLEFRTGRPWMFSCAIYIDGVYTRVPNVNWGGGRVAQNLTKGIDLLLDPSMVAGVEVYRVGEIPPQYNATLTGASSMATGGTNDGCVTLIWTR